MISCGYVEDHRYVNSSKCSSVHADYSVNGHDDDDEEERDMPHPRGLRVKWAGAIVSPRDLRISDKALRYKSKRVSIVP